jgi:eukaryotic translation initiation factor 2C
MAKIKFNTGGTAGSWSYLMISMPGGVDVFQDRQSAIDAMAKFHTALKGMGINVPPPAPGSKLTIARPDGGKSENLQKLDRELEGALNRAPQGQVRMMLIILPVAHTLLYNRIKYIADVKLGIHTICVVGTKFAKLERQDQYFGNVALKFNLKLGGVNQLVEPARYGIIAENKTMVVGLDVTHPSPGSASNAPSVAGIVASIDRWLGQWPADIRIQTGRKEMVSDLKELLKSRLKLWKNKGRHEAFPENILIYRDGVSEGQYQLVIGEELPLLREACKEMYPATDTKKGLPRITIVIVGKRHHTRFYPTKEADADRSANPKNGTVVDRGVTEAVNWDFFLQAHTALQGTARPAHYYVVLDEIFSARKVMPPYENTADVLEDLTHSMCYLFGRATKAVSICPPAYYADIVCERARCYLSHLFDMPTPEPSVSGGQSGESEPRGEDVLVHQNLRDSMFYI